MAARDREVEKEWEDGCEGGGGGGQHLPLEGEVPGAEEGGVGGGAEQLLHTLVVGMRKEG